MKQAGLTEAGEKIACWRRRPSVMVRELFGAEPDPWQEEALDAFPSTQRLALKAAKGPGKSTVLAWIGWNYLLTRPHPKIGATSISAANLADGLWTEMAKWRLRSALTREKFVWTKTRIFAADHPETWFMAAKAWSQSADQAQQANTLAGFHADYVLFLIDESGAMPPAIVVTAEAALAGCVEAHIVQAGNPSTLDGALYRAAMSRLWRVIEITGDPDDPKRSSRIAIDYAREQIEQYGRENPWVIVNIFGRFPPTSINALIGADEVRAAMKRHYREHEIGDAPRVLGVDVARQGADVSVIFPRQGIQAFPPLRLRNVDSAQGAGHVALRWREWDADSVFIDASGGFGAGWIDQLRLLGRAPVGVQFAGAATKKERYANKRAEIYFELVEWIKRGGALPDLPELTSALTQTTYSFAGDRLLLEPKDAIRAKLGYSPDDADALALTFSAPVTRHAERVGLRSAGSAAEVYRPFAELDRAVEIGRSRDAGVYNPFATLV